MGIANPIFNAVKKYAGREAMDLDAPVLKKVSSWLMGETTEKPMMEALYRGVPKDAERIAPEVAEYTHATPWGSVAGRGGKGAFESPSAFDVYSFPASKETKLYRGGSLEGDPLESTRIGTAKGALWDEALDNAKDTYYTELTRRKADIVKRYKDDPEWLSSELEMLPKHTAEDIAYEFKSGTFETDLGGKPGIWHDQYVPPELSRKRPKLRSYDDLEDALLNKHQQGFGTEDLIASPEARILRRGQPQRYDEILHRLRNK